MGTLKNFFIVIAVIIFLAIGGIIAVRNLLTTKGLMLIAEETVPVYSTKEQAMTWPQPNAMSEIASGQSVQVTECVDVKHYLIYKVHLPDKRYGYVLEGKYVLIRDGKQGNCR